MAKPSSRLPTYRLWAPWRARFLSQKPGRRCIFCTAKMSADERRHHVILRDAKVFALLNRYPYSNGHLLIAPYRHVRSLEALSDSEWTGILQVSKYLSKRLRQILHPKGFNIGLNLGRVAGAGIPGHLHLHLVPRWDGDTNFMPALTSTRVISQSLDELHTLLTRRSKA